MKQTVVVLALALLFALGVTLSFTADSFGPAATAETTGPAPATQVEAPQPVFTSSVKPAEPDVPVAMLDDVPPRPAAGPAPTAGSAVQTDAPTRWFVESGTSPSPRTANALITPYPFAPTTTVAVAATKPAPETRAEAKPPEAADARPARRSQNSNAQMPARRRAANARACGSSSRWTDLLRRLNLASRCPTRRSAA